MSPLPFSSAGDLTTGDPVFVSLLGLIEEVMVLLGSPCVQVRRPLGLGSSKASVWPLAVTSAALGTQPGGSSGPVPAGSTQLKVGTHPLSLKTAPHPTCDALEHTATLQQDTPRGDPHMDGGPAPHGATWSLGCGPGLPLECYSSQVQAVCSLAGGTVGVAPSTQASCYDPASYLPSCSTSSHGWAPCWDCTGQSCAGWRRFEPSSGICCPPGYPPVPPAATWMP